MTSSEPLNLTVDELLTTTRSVRKRLDLEKPVLAEDGATAEEARRVEVTVK